MTSATNERAIAEARRRQREDLDIERQTISTLMASTRTRRYLWLELSRSQIFIEEETLDHPRMCYLKGIRTQGLRLLSLITTHCPNEYITMTRENSSVKLEDQSDGGPDSDS